jgi:hypothetical protein
MFVPLTAFSLGDCTLGVGYWVFQLKGYWVFQLKANQRPMCNDRGLKIAPAKAAAKSPWP